MSNDANVGANVTRWRWLVLAGGLARAEGARLLSAHRTREAAERRAAVERTRHADVYVTSADEHAAWLAGGVAAVQGLAGRERFAAARPERCDDGDAWANVFPARCAWGPEEPGGVAEGMRWGWPGCAERSR